MVINGHLEITEEDNSIEGKETGRREFFLSQNPHSAKPTISKPSTPVTVLLPAVCGAVLVAVLSPHMSTAIDHPIDQLILGIPSPVPDPRFFVAGGLSAAASHGITTPIDVIKTRMQADENLRRASLTQAALSLWQREGPTTLLEGLGPTVTGYGVEGSLKFGLYESMKPTFAQWLHSTDLTIPYLLASVSAGAIASIVLCPMEQLRIRSVTDPTFGGLSDLISENGLLGLFRGLPSMLSKQVPYTYGKQVTYDEFASLLYSMCEKSFGWNQSAIKFEVSVVAAFLASLAACILSHPGDVILTSTYKKSTSSGDSSRGELVAIAQRLYAERGFGAFFAGLSARFVHVAVIVTSQLVLYDMVKQLLGLPATGTQ
jgi:solute carrier family 25 phosphate transporter 3